MESNLSPPPKMPSDGPQRGKSHTFMSIRLKPPHLINVVAFEDAVAAVVAAAASM